MIPRWAIIVAAILAVIWIINDPAGAGQFVNGLGNSIVTFGKNLG